MKEGKLLWCCHVRGPDDVHPAESYEQAREWADEINFELAPHKGVERHKHAPVIIAAPRIWPWSPEQHAAGVEQYFREEMIRRLRLWNIQQAQEAE
jgi:hypothetical protein